MLEIQNKGTGELFYATSESGGFDLRNNGENFDLLPGERRIAKTGLFIARAETGYIQVFRDINKDINKLSNPAALEVLPVLDVVPRSGQAFKKGLTVLNSPGTVDMDFTGPDDEIGVILINLGKEILFINNGDRIAQGVCKLVFRAAGVAVKEDKRSGGFNSTGDK